jgi:hypothetical protein
MGYRNKTYVIFDADNDMWAYAYMKGWKKNKNIDFDFHDAHDLNIITDASAEANTKRKLRQRFDGAKQAVVLIGDSTKNLFRFVRWEIEVCQELGLPVVAVNLNGERAIDLNLCPAILRDSDAVHVSFNARLIKYGLDNFCPNYAKYVGQGKNWSFKASVYKDLGL